MAEQRLNNLSQMIAGMARTPWLRQLLMLVGIAAAVAVGMAAVLWSRGPDYRVLYSSLAPERASAVVDTLTTLNIPYRIEDQSGAITVPAEKLNEARLKLAGSGLAQGDGSGLEMMNEEKGFAVSEFMESKKYQHALETELARTIESMRQVRKARVHLAIPKQSVFVRERKPASASIFLDVFPGSSVAQENVNAIVNLVAASIPDLAPEQVTVVDQMGNLLSRNGPRDQLEQGTRQFEYRQHVEKAYEERISQLLAPVIASGQVKVQVAADIDFSTTQESRESWNPANQVVRSEQINQSQRSGDAGATAATGVPGALSNQPPLAAAATPPAAAGKGAATPPAPAVSSNGSTSITRSYEIERTLNHVDAPAGSIRKLSVAVVVDNRPQRDAKGKVIKPGPTATELERLNGLVRDAIGFSAERGDRVSVIAADFRGESVPVADDEPGFWQQPWFASLLKQGLAGVAILLVVLLVLRPGMRQLMQSPAAVPGLPALPDGSPAYALSGPGVEQPMQRLTHEPAPRLPVGLASAALEERMSAVRQAANEDPRKVAQVVKNWVNNHADT